MKKEFISGIKDGAAIGIGYFSVSFSFGILAVSQNLTALQATVISMTNLTSAGQFAGLAVITAGTGIIEMILTQLIINLRYALMSLSLSQKLPQNIGIIKRSIIAFSNTDEIYAVAMSRPHSLTFPYLLGLALLPWIGWSAGTLTGSVAGAILPAAVQSALGIALYGMFISIVVPVTKSSKPVTIVVIIAMVASCMFAFVPVLKEVSSGFAIVICTVAASAAGALLFPVNSKEADDQ